MAVRKSEIRRLRRELISRTARVWSSLNKSLVKELNEIANSWLKEIISDQRAGENFPEIPEKFIKVLNKNLREAMAYGYWLSYLYVQGLSGNKYRGKISLSDHDDSTREGLIDFIAGEWNDVIPEDAVKWLEGYTPKLAGNFSNAVLEKTRDVIRESMLAGDTLQERMKALRSSIPELSELSRHRIEAIARTEITRADTMGRLMSAKANDDVIGFEFSAIMDDRTTDMCALRHGLFMKIDDPRLPFNTPPLHVNCVLGDTLISPIGKISAYSERVFDGNIFIIKTAGGNNLSGTPNHPVLTSRGWVPLCEIQEGDYVVCNTLGKRGNVINGEDKQVVACIKDTAHAFFDNSKVRATPVPVSSEDFHHDGGKSNVAIIYTDRELLNRGKTFTNEQVIKNNFMFRYVVRSFFKHCKGVLFFFLNRFFSSSDGFMSFLRKSLSLFRSCTLHSCKLLFMPVTWFYFMFKKDTFNSFRCFDVKSLSNTANTYTLIMQADDNFMVDSVNGTFPLNTTFAKDIIDYIKIGSIFFAKFCDTDTREIFFDKVINVSYESFSGHVYNLQTESGIFVANNIITHNCRSMLLEVTKYEYPEGIETSIEFNEVPASNVRPEDIEEVQKILQAVKVETLTPPTIEAQTQTEIFTMPPEIISGTNEERAKIFEEIDKNFDAPSGVMSEYTVEYHGKTAEILFENNYLRGEDILLNLPNGRKASEAEKSGAIKHAIYYHRPKLELAALSRRGGFASLEMFEKWGGRLLTDQEKEQVDHEMEEFILQLFKSPLTQKGRELNEGYWHHEIGGWRREN